MCAISASVLAISTPTVPPPTRTNVSSCCIAETQAARVQGGDLFSVLKGQQYLGPNLVGIPQRNKTSRDLGPIVVPKVVVLNAGGENKEIIWHFVLLDANDSLLRIDAAHFAQKNIDIALAVEDRSQRAGNFVSRQQASSDLIEHWPEEMVVALVNERYLEWSANQRTRCIESTKAATNNHDARPRKSCLYFGVISSWSIALPVEMWKFFASMKSLQAALHEPAGSAPIVARLNPQHTLLQASTLESTNDPASLAHIQLETEDRAKEV